MTIEQYEKIMEYVDTIIDLSEWYIFHGEDYNEQRER